MLRIALGSSLGVWASLLKRTLGAVSNVAIFGLSLFQPAATLDWWRAWVFLGVVRGVVLVRAGSGEV